MPTTISGFKDHPLYALERHLRRDEVIQPLKEIGKFRGESVYPRAHVIPLKSAENWMRVGRKVKPGCQPMKQVKLRAATINKQREIELAMADDESGAGIMQGLYALTQTELYRPDPIVNVSICDSNVLNINSFLNREKYLRTTSAT
jgi:xeroderma pigmentosum group C-complementing protein